MNTCEWGGGGNPGLQFFKVFLKYFDKNFCGWVMVEEK